MLLGKFERSGVACRRGGGEAKGPKCHFSTFGDLAVPKSVFSSRAERPPNGLKLVFAPHRGNFSRKFAQSTPFGPNKIFENFNFSRGATFKNPQKIFSSSRAEKPPNWFSRPLGNFLRKLAQNACPKSIFAANWDFGILTGRTLRSRKWPFSLGSSSAPKRPRELKSPK